MTHLSQISPSSSGGKPICSICYEDLKPITEDLQSISVCGHVFHELCLQQWQEYCPRGKKCTCPVCKQSYSLRDVIRLFFQSSCEKITQSEGTDEKILTEEIETLQGKICSLNSALDLQKQRVGELNSEVLEWKNRAEKEEKLKADYLKDKEITRHLLQRKEAELCKTSEDCSRFREKSFVLAKELASLKLAMDVNLGEEEIARLVSIGQKTTADAVDVLQRSLLLRNKCYKELMTQCNSLGRAETHALKKLEKSEGKIKMLKMRLHELEKAVEMKDCEILSILKRSNQKSPEQLNRDFTDASSKSCDSNWHKAFGHPVPSSTVSISIVDDSSMDDPVSDHVYDMNNLASCEKFMDGDEGFPMMPSIRLAEKSSGDCAKLFSDSSFPVNLIGTKDTTKYPKWRKAPLKPNPSMQMSNSCRGGLIALGADGRGGKIKILRGLDKFPEAKVGRLVPKQSKRQKALPIQSQSHQGIEQYFGKTNMNM